MVSVTPNTTCAVCRKQPLQDNTVLPKLVPITSPSPTHPQHAMTQLSYTTTTTTSPRIGMATSTSASFSSNDVLLDTGSNIALFRDKSWFDIARPAPRAST